MMFALPSYSPIHWFEIICLLVVLYYLFIYTIIGILGCIKCYKLQALLANIFIIIPSNVTWTISYVLLMPLRLIFVRLMNMVMTTVISIFTIKPNICNASFEKLLSAFPIGYKFLLGVDIMEIDEKHARKLMRQRIQQFPFPYFRKSLSKCLCTPNMLNSFVFRLVIATTLFPLLGWWLIGYSYIPFVPIFSSSAKQQDESTNDNNNNNNKIQSSSASINDVVLEIPCCTFLTRARKAYNDETKGNRACINE